LVCVHPDALLKLKSPILLETEKTMAVMVTTEILRQTQIGYDALFAKIEAELKRAPGFLVHYSHRLADGWRHVEVWETNETANTFFENNILPLLPAGRKPLRTFQDLHLCVVKPSKGRSSK